MDARWTSLEIRTLALCFILNMLDGADVLVVSFVAPVLTQAWEVSDAAFGVVFSSGLAGMTLGALLIAPFADLFGRKTLILIATAMIGSGMVLSAGADTLGELVALRFWTGLGIGSMLASVAALASEFAPSRYRAFAVAFATAGYPAGAVLAGLIARVIIPQWGWPAIFMVVGLGSVIMLPAVWLALPESVQYLLARQPRNALDRANRILAAQRRPSISELPAAPAAARRAPVAELFAAEYRSATLLLWGSFFASFFTLYFLTSWIPRIAVGAGFPLETAFTGSAVFNAGAFVGLVALGWFASRFNLARLIGVFFALSALGMLAFGAQHTPTLVFYLGLLAIGFLVQGGFGGLYAVAAAIYPAEIKATGVGWSIGIGRLGAVAGPLVGGLALSAGFGILANFAAFAVPMIIAALLSLALARRPQ